LGEVLRPLPTLVVCAKYPDLFAGFRDSVERDSDCLKILVRDGTQIPCPDGWATLTPGTPFNAAVFGNIGWRAALDRDIIYCGDDIRFIEPHTIQRLQKIAYEDEVVGMLSPKIIGGAQTEQNIVSDHLRYATHFIGMMFAYLKRSTIERVGYLDEDYVGFGYEDVDYNKRIERAGLRIGLTGDVSVQHGFDELGHSTTFRRTQTWSELCAEAEENGKRYESKHIR
jgi:GT2 family glycosyltransferase